MTKNIKFIITRFVFPSKNAPKSVFGRGSAPDPAGGAYDAPPDPLVGWGGGYPLPIPLPYGASVLRPPQRKILATPVGYARGLFANEGRQDS